MTNITVGKCKISENLIAFVNRNQDKGIGEVVISKSTYKAIRLNYGLPELPVPFQILEYNTVVRGSKEYEIELL